MGFADSKNVSFLKKFVWLWLVRLNFIAIARFNVKGINHKEIVALK